MWLIAAIQTAVSAAIGVVTWLSPEIPKWKKALVIVLTAISVVGIGINQWWEQHEKSVHETQRVATLEKLSEFIASGESLMTEISSMGDQPVPKDRANEWFNGAKKFLQTLGQSYVTRFNSMAGIAPISLNNADADHNNWWVGIHGRVIRLHEFSAEFSGQIPKIPSGNPL